MTSVSALNFCLLSGFLLLGSVMLAVRLLPEARASFLGLLTYGGFTFLCLIIGIQTILGWMGILTGTWVTVTGYGLGAVMIALSARSFKAHCPLPKKPHPALLLLIPLGILLLIELYNGLIFPVWEYDSISYHLPMVRQWFLSGSLRQAYFSVFAGPVGYYPSTGELLTLWPMLLTKSDAFANIQNILLLPLGAAALLQWTRRNGIPDRTGILCPLLCLTSPIVLKELGAPHVDFFFMLTFIFALLFLTDFVRNGTVRSWLLTCLALGLFLGTKYLAVPVGIPLLAITIVQVVRRLKYWKGIRLGAITGGVVAFMLMGGHWYLRNMLLTGNPLFPASLSIGSFTILHGYGSMSDTMFSVSLLSKLPSMSLGVIPPLTTLFVWRMGYQILLMLLATFLIIPMLCRECLQPGRRMLFRYDTWILAILPVLIVLYLAAPNTYLHFDANIRYAILLLPVGGYLTAELANRSRPLAAILTIGSILIISITLVKTLRAPDLPHETGTLRLIQESLPVFLPFALRFITLAIVCGLLTWTRWKRQWRIGLLITMIALLPSTLLLPTGAMSAMRQEQTFPSLHEKYSFLSPLLRGFEWIARETKTDDRIAYAGFHFRYPLMHPLDRTVEYVPVNDCLHCNYVDFRDEPEGIYARASKEQWIRNLRTAEISYLILHNESGFLSYEPGWAESMPEVFEPVFREEGVEVFKVIMK
ncbi:MAG: hypothetical protein PHZ00_03290 [Candidatus Peribacteraceae bacterium]|nr:hypothetical protein [Candidatus Peribacteraceae bacterium]